MISQRRIQTYSHLTIKDMQKGKTQVKWSFSPCLKISMALLWIWIQEFGTILMSLVSHGLCFVLLWITEVHQLKGECDSQRLSCTIITVGYLWEVLGGGVTEHSHLTITCLWQQMFTQQDYLHTDHTVSVILCVCVCQCSQNKSISNMRHIVEVSHRRLIVPCRPNLMALVFTCDEKGEK